MIMLDSNTTVPDDLETSSAVPGAGKDMAPVTLEGGYAADFGGVTYQVIINPAGPASYNSLIFNDCRETRYCPGHHVAIHEEN